MATRKFTAALFENVDFKAQANQVAKQNNNRIESVGPQETKIGIFSRMFSLFSKEKVQWPRVLLFGDSLTQYAFSDEGCWGALLADKLQRRVDVVNRGFSGYNTRWCRMLIDQVFSDESPERLACVVILLGSNDAADPEVLEQTHVPLTEYEDNLSNMVATVTGKFNVDPKKVVLISPPPVNTKLVEDTAARMIAEGHPNPWKVAHCNERTGQYAEACKRVATERGVSILDLHNLMLADSEWPFFFNDGIHFTRKGAEFLFHALWPLVQSRVAELPFKYPYWGDIVKENPKESLVTSDVYNPDFPLD